MGDEQDPWLSNFTNNPLKWFKNYHIRFSPGYYHYIPEMIKELEKELASHPEKADRLKARIAELKEDLVKTIPITLIN